MYSSQIPFSLYKSVHFYLDPGTGSMIIQLVIAALLGGAILLRTFWKKIFHKKSKKDDAPMETPTEDTKDVDLPK